MPKIISEYSNDALKKWSHLLTEYEIYEEMPEYQKRMICLLIENQNLFMAQKKSKSIIADQLKLVASIWANSPVFDMVSVQTLLGPAGLVYFRQDGELKSADIAARTCMAKTCLFPEKIQDSLTLKGPAASEELIIDTALEIRQGIIHEIAYDLRNNVGTTIECKKSDLESAIERAKMAINKKIGKEANWLYAKSLGDFKANQMCRFNINSMRVIIDPSFIDNEVLIGYKGEQYDAGYIYSPYIPYSESGLAIDPESDTARCAILMRYGKKLLSEGRLRYARIITK